MKNLKRQRKGAVAIFLGILLVPLLVLLAFSIDYGFLLLLRTDLQRASDQAVLAAVRDLTPDDDGYQDLDKVRATVREYVAMNLGEDFEVLDSDIEIGRYNPAKIYSSFELLKSGTYDTVRVSLHRDDMANNSVSLYFARLFGREEADISAYSTAVLQRARYIGPGTGVFPFAIQQQAWNRLDPGDAVSIYGNGGLQDEYGRSIPGNWGTIDIGPKSNSTNDLNKQIENGISQNDLNSLKNQGAIPDSNHIDSQQSLTLNGDTGLSAGLKQSVSAVEGTRKLIPIYRNSTGKGGNLNFEVIGWGVVLVSDSRWNGNKNTYIEVRKGNMYDGGLKPNSDLSDISNTIDGAFTSPVLVE